MKTANRAGEAASSHYPGLQNLRRYFQWPSCSLQSHPVDLQVLQVRRPPRTPVAVCPLQCGHSCSVRWHFVHSTASPLAAVSGLPAAAWGSPVSRTPTVWVRRLSPAGGRAVEAHRASERFHHRIVRQSPTVPNEPRFLVSRSRFPKFGQYSGAKSCRCAVQHTAWLAPRDPRDLASIPRNGL